MDLPDFSWSQACVCGRIFSVPQAYTYHRRSCQKTKKRISDALAKANNFCQAKKRQKIGESPAVEYSLNENVVVETQLNDEFLILAQPQTLETPTIVDYDDLDRPLPERRNRREHRRLPKRFRDTEPEPPAEPPSVQDPSLTMQEEPDPQQHPPSSVQDRKTLRSAYSNQSSFLLGEWYWNGGDKKSRLGFQSLLRIVGHPSFRPEEISNQNWALIDAQLSRKSSDSRNEGEGSANEQEDADWIQTPIRINVPFHSCMLHPGPKEFDAGILHHRKLASVIKEKISQLSADSHFHFEPYELFWQPNGAVEPVRVYGELYTSEAFFETHRVLQDSPGEPECDLPRVVLGIMFASDSTRLTAFSSAKLCPVYLSIGNQSKDERMKPSCQAFEHVAYLETLPDAFKAFAAENIGGKGPNSTFMAHCQREMYHAQWATILDDEDSISHPFQDDGQYHRLLDP